MNWGTKGQLLSLVQRLNEISKYNF